MGRVGRLGWRRGVRWRFIELWTRDKGIRDEG